MDRQPRGQRIRPRACMDCHARKVKCDGATTGFPCSNCKTARVECIVAERRKRKKATSRAAQPRNPPSPAPAPAPPPDPGPQAAAELPTSDEAQALMATEYAGDCELAKQHLVKFFSQDPELGFNNAGKARSIFVGNELANLNHLTQQRQHVQQQPPPPVRRQHVYHYPCANVYVPRVFRGCSSVATPNLIPRDAFVLPPKHVSDILVADYFRHVHLGFPVLDREEFLAQYRARDSSPPLLLMHAVCLVGSHVTSEFDNKQDLKVALFRRAKALLDGHYDLDRKHIVQACLLLTWFSDGGDDVSANAWWWIGIASRTAMGLGMHRDASPSKMPKNDLRMWKTIWWAVVQFDTLVSLCYGRPQSVNLDDCDMPPLTLDDFEPSTSATAAHFVIQHAKLCALISDLSRTHLSVRARKSGIDGQSVLAIIDSALADWLLNLPPELREHNPKPSSTTEWDPWPSLLHLTYNAALIQFHRALSGDSTSAAGTTDGAICADAASNIVRVFDRLGQRSALRCCWFWAPSTLFTALLQLSGQLQSSNPILAIRVREQYDSGLASLQKLARHWLFATSVLRLFQQSALPVLQKAPTGEADSITVTNQMLEMESPVMTASSLGPSPVNAGGAGLDPSQAGMDWVGLLQYGDPAAEGMHMERNQWQDSMNEWRTLYWSDPLTNLRFGDGFRDECVDWPLLRPVGNGYEEPGP